MIRYEPTKEDPMNATPEISSLVRDAKIKTAAPEMLHALKVFARVFGEMIDNDIEMNGSDTVESVCEIWPIIKRAIRKAEEQ